MIINHNMNAMNAHRLMTGNTTNVGKSMEKLSSGLRINRAGDDAAGLAISEKMRGQIRGLDQAARNSQDGISMIQTAEGALNETHSILQRMRELATQAANDTNVGVDRSEIQKEMNQLTNEINRIGNTTEFNTQKLLDGGGSKVTDKTVGTTTAGGKAGQIGTVQTITTSATGKSLASFTANGFEVSIEANNTTNNLGGKTITFDTTATTAGSEAVTVSGSAVTINVHADSTLDQIQTALNNSSAFSGNGGVTLKITKADGSAVAGATQLSAAGTSSPTAAQLKTATTAPAAPAGFTAGGGTVNRGVYSFDVKEAFVHAGDTFKLKLASAATPSGFSEITLTAAQAGTNAATGALAGTFNIGADAAHRLSAEDQAAAIATSLKNGAWDLDNVKGGNQAITDIYDISYNGSSVIFTEKNAMGPQASVKNGAFTATQAVSGVSTYAHNSDSMVEAGGSFIIDGTEIAVVDGKGEKDAANIAAGKAILRTDTDGNTAATQIDLLQEAITRNADLNAKYTATDNNTGTLTLAQNTGHESTTLPKLSTTNKAGQQFEATFQIGANTAQSLTIEVKDMRAEALKISGGTEKGEVTAKNGTKAYYVATKDITDGTTNEGKEYALDVSSHGKATAAISVINDAIEKVSAERSKLGAYQNRLEHTIANLGTASENLTSAESRVRDVDMAKEMMNQSKNNILAQAAQAMLGQANQQPQQVLQLLR